MACDKKTSYCIQNFFSEEGEKFYYARMLLEDVSESDVVFPILKSINASIKFGTFSRIDDNKIKWAFTFTVPEPLNEKEFIEELKKTKARSVTNWKDDIIFLAEGFGYSPEYPIIGYLTMEPGTEHSMILAGGLWYRLISSMDDILHKDGTDIVMHNAGREHGRHMAGGPADMFKIPKNVDGEGFEIAIKKLFRAYGYCDIEKIDTDGKNKKVTKIQVKHSAFSITNFIKDDIIHMDKTRKCHFQVGIFNGFFSTRLGTEHEFEEIECVGEGKAKCIYKNNA